MTYRQHERKLLVYYTYGPWEKRHSHSGPDDESEDIGDSVVNRTNSVPISIYDQENFFSPFCNNCCLLSLMPPLRQQANCENVLWQFLKH